MSIFSKIFSALFSGGIRDIGEAIDRNVTSEEERLKLKNEAKEIMGNMAIESMKYENQFEQEVTKRQQADSQSDNQLQKSYRPIIAIIWNGAMILMLIGVLIWYPKDGTSQGVLEVVWTSTISMVGIINVALFGSRGIEKFKKISMTNLEKK